MVPRFMMTLTTKIHKACFFSPVTEEEVVGIVRTCNSKTSTDSNSISMAIPKKTMYNLLLNH